MGIGVAEERRIHEFVCELHAIHFKQWREVVQSAMSEWVDDKAPRLGAALAFYSALSLAPLLMVVLAVAGLAYGKQAAEGRLVWQIRDMVGGEGAKAIQAVISAAHKPASGIIATTVGLATLFFSASSAFVELTDALNTIWRVPVSARQSNIASLFAIIKNRGLAFVMVLGAGFLLLSLLIVSTWITAVETFFRDLLPMPAGALDAVNLLLSFLVMTFIFAMIYKVLPDVRLQWGDVAVGAAITSLLFTIGKYLIGLYLRTSTVASSYGAAGSFLVVLLWVYYSAQVFFLGAEFTKVYTRQYGSHFRAKLQLQAEHQAKQPELVITRQ